MIEIDWTRYYQLCNQIFQQIKESEKQYTLIIAITRGGFYLGDFLSRKLELPLGTIAVSSYVGHKQGTLKMGSVSTVVDLQQKPWQEKVLLVDDLVDSGNTMLAVTDKLNNTFSLVNIDTACIWRKPHSTFEPNYYAIDNETGWIVQPFEV